MVCDGTDVLEWEMDYTHHNTVLAMIVVKAVGCFVFISRDYAGERGLVKI